MGDGGRQQGFRETLERRGGAQKNPDGTKSTPPESPGHTAASVPGRPLRIQGGSGAEPNPAQYRVCRIRMSMESSL